MKITITGAGLAGLATAHYALKKGHQVRVYSLDPSASKVGSGLLHPFGGTRGKVNRLGFEGMNESLQLIQPNAIVKKGILRLAVNETLRESFWNLSRQEHVKWLTPDEVQARNPGLKPFPGILIEEGYVIDMKVHLQNLSQGITIIHEEFKECQWADVLIWATGAWSPHVKKVKGQTLKIKLKNHGINDPINANCYLIPNEEGFLLGATYERDDLTWTSDIQKAKLELFPKLGELISNFDEAEILEVSYGIRATTPDHMPLIKQLDYRNWIYTGLGSKGLLYHALFAKKLLNLIEEQQNSRKRRTNA